MNDELEQYKKVQLKKARMTAVVLGLAAVLAVLFMIYGFTQSIEVGRQRDLYLVEKTNAVNEKINTEKEIASLKEQLANCQSGKK